MKSIFSPDSKVFKVMNRIADLIILNAVYLATCVPVFTIGAATTAMYSVCFHMDTENEQGVIGPYFRAFKENWKQATGIFIPLFLLLCAGIFDIFLFYNSTGFLHHLWWLVAPVVAVAGMVLAIVLPLISQFENSWKATLKNALLLSLGRLPAALFLAAAQLLPFALLYLNPAIFIRIGFLWILIYFSSVAYLGSKILRKAFGPLYEKSTHSSETE